MHLLISTHLVTTADPSLGRIGASSLSQQTLMELFVAGIGNKRSIWNTSTEPPDLSSWEGITLNSDGEVTEINWNLGFSIKGFLMNGSVDFQWIPSTVTKCVISKTQLQGSLPTSALPESLIDFCVNDNTFSGELALSKLPRNIEMFVVAHNDFSGKFSKKDGVTKIRLKKDAVQKFGQKRMASNFQKRTP